ncbi:MAG: ribonuclease D [Neomegalonema sp.]|nr:ribonuclease D [Neomegalonema sp.]
MAIYFHEHDLPDGLDLGAQIAVDSETMGLQPHRDRLCVVQLSAGDGDAHLVRIGAPETAAAKAPNLIAQLGDPSRLKLFHFARFDLAVLALRLGVMPSPCYCTKIASKLARTYTDRHGLKDVAREIAGAEISKQQQSSDWGADALTDAQKNYAADDVLHLHAIKAGLDRMLAREGRTELAQACFDFLPTRARLDLAGWPETDIFAHS